MKNTRRDNLKMQVKSNKAITLIALIITIIVLLILAGVSVTTLTGDNGLLTKANEAKLEAEEAKEDEARKLTVLEASTNIESQPYTDKNGDTATIPANFTVSQVEGENTIENGLVIIDKNGNEFVWIPIDDINIPYQKWCTGGVDYNQTTVSDDILPNNIIKKLQVWYNSNETITENLIKESISKYKGFYVARYDAGIPENSDIIIDKDVTTYNNTRDTCFKKK